MRNVILASFVFLAACGSEHEDKQQSQQDQQSGFNLTLPVPVPSDGSDPIVLPPVFTEHKCERDAREWLEAQSKKHVICHHHHGRRHIHWYGACWPDKNKQRQCTFSTAIIH